MTNEIVGQRVVFFDDSGEEIAVVRDCKRCLSAAVVYGCEVVSPAGIAHICEDETTLCGKDATGAGWWWPL